MKRAVSALILGVATIFLVLEAPFWLAAGVLSLAVIAAVREMADLVYSGDGSLVRVWVYSGSLLILAGGIFLGARGLSAGLAVGVLLVMAGSIRGFPVKGAVGRSASGFFILLVPVWCLGHILLYLSRGEGRLPLLFLLVCIWASDTAAYYAGSAFGRRKLAPAISPNKTWLGSAAGILGSIAAALVFRWFAPLQWSFSFVVFSGLLLSVLGQAGDLAESLIKRDAGVKDSGSIIPGHGGILDRMDALLFTVPLFYYVLSWVSRSPM